MRFLIVPLMALVVVGCKKHDADKQATEDREIITDYIAENGLDASSTSTGIYYVIEEEGTGAHPYLSSTVTVDYRGYYTSGEVFDESSPAGATFALTNVIEGWQEGIPLFKEGSKGILLIPSALAYGPSGQGSIPPNTVLIFDINLIDVQ